MESRRAARRGCFQWRRAGAQAAAHRRYNREYMRRWRADPRHRRLEQAARVRSYLRQKLRRASRQRQLYVNQRGEPVCGFCWRRPPVRMAERLRIC